MRKANSLSPFIKVGSNDLRPTTPHVFLEVKGLRPQLSLNLPYNLEFTFRRAENDGSERPCIFRWRPEIDGFSPPGFVLLHHNGSADGVEPLKVDYVSRQEVPREDSVVVEGQNDHLWELTPGGSASFVYSLPGHYYRALQAGETYTLLFTGGEVASWDWGTIQEHLGREVRAQDGMLPALMIPGGACVSFTAQTEETPWPGRAAYEAHNGFDAANLAEQQWQREQYRKRWGIPAGFEPRDRVPGAPILTVTMECAPTVTGRGPFGITIKVTYTGQICGPDGQLSTTTRPITFRVWSITADFGETTREGFWLHRQRGASGNGNGNGTDTSWEVCSFDSDKQGFRLYDAPDVAVHVAQYRHFTSLRPGESWTHTTWLETDTWGGLPDDIAPGDVFLYGFSGNIVEWWDWGGVEEHADTVVMLPSWIAGRVVNPRDNGGRPRLVVPQSEPIEFRVVG
ncbi:hypothetical protein B0I37DRAFT_330220 [Chaetomium sp. MPI-CAGE-AT-0009]|nr:hypothetical protein B0I37DRAFT_330220 [Chaetomium sp. MPI-CAGE-AT-0009]